MIEVLYICYYCTYADIQIGIRLWTSSFGCVINLLVGSTLSLLILFFFFFQAEDGIRDKLVTGVQTCALPISRGLDRGAGHLPARRQRHAPPGPPRLRRHARRRPRLHRQPPLRPDRRPPQIGRASCRERV